MCKPPSWFECYFHCSSWIHCWLLLAVLSDYFGQLVTSSFLLCKFRRLPGSTPVSFPVMRRWKCVGMKRLSQSSSTTPCKRAEKLAEAKADVKQVTQNPGRICFILNIVITFGNKIFFITHCGNWKRVFKIICMQCVLCVCKSSCKLTRGNKSLPKHKTIIEDLDNIIKDFKIVRLGLKQNRYTALTSVNVQTRPWFISAAVASVKFPLCCSCSGGTFGLFFPCL